MIPPVRVSAGPWDRKHVCTIGSILELLVRWWRALFDGGRFALPFLFLWLTGLLESLRAPRNYSMSSNSVSFAMFVVNNAYDSLKRSFCCCRELFLRERSDADFLKFRCSEKPCLKVRVKPLPSNSIVFRQCFSCRRSAFGFGGV